MVVVGVGHALFDGVGDAFHDVEAFEWVFTDGGFAGEHDAVGFFEDGVSDVGDFGSGGDGGFDHAFEHVCSDGDGAAEVDAAFDHVTLDDGEFLVGAFDTEVTASDHDGVGFEDDFVEVGDAALVFDFGDDFGLAVSGFEVIA